MSKNIKSELKGERFKRVASRRTQRVLDALRRLGNCANKGVYEYSSEEVGKIFRAIDAEFKRVKARFEGTSNTDKFSL